MLVNLSTILKSSFFLATYSLTLRLKATTLFADLKKNHSTKSIA
jgi:hypothetical protein